MTRRILMVIPLLLAVTVLAFLLLELVPGDAARRIVGPDASAEQVEQIRRALGLDRPMYVRYWEFASSAARGDLGTTLFGSEPVVTRIARHLPATASLAGMALLLSVLFAIPAGVLAAMKPDSLLDRGLTGLSALAMSVPSFIIAIILVSFLALQSPWLPATGYRSPSLGIGLWLRHLLLPGVALAVLPAAELARQIRGSMRDALESDYVTTARAKGLRTPATVLKHAGKNAAIPVVTVFGLLLNRIIGGAVVIEAVFAFPGIGTMTIGAVFSRDLPVIQGVVLISAVAVILLNLLVDLSYTYFNPKLRQ